MNLLRRLAKLNVKRTVIHWFYSCHIESIFYTRRATEKAHTITHDNTHALAQYFTHLQSGRRYRVPRMRTNRLKNSFVPGAIAIMNK